ncbi:MAG: HPr family phosphocarrier protein [Lachnospiraceae bacterium]|nr:HPr family phosphocarrier protein [Lachnospiraceae bacterium]
MIKKNITVNLKDGLIARPVAMFVQVASQFESRIYIETPGMKINAKSIMGMMTLGIQEGREWTVTADGADETFAIDKIETFLTKGA